MQSHLSAAHFHSEEAAYAFAEARLWPGGPMCPHCGATKEHVGSCGENQPDRALQVLCLPQALHGQDWHRLRVPSRADARLASDDLPVLFVEEGHFDPPTSTHLWLRAENRMVPWSPCARGDARSRRRRHRPLGGANQVVEADETYVGGKAANRKGKIPPKAIMLSLSSAMAGPELPCAERDRADLEADHRHEREQGDVSDDRR